MAFPYKTILCPVDFDENSLAALDKAVEIARHLGSSIILVHVLPLNRCARRSPAAGGALRRSGKRRPSQAS